MATNRRSHLFILEHLRHAGFSDEDAAEVLGVNRETVWRWRTKQHKLNPQKIRALADLCGVDPGDLWRMPGLNSIDKILNGADDNVRQAVADVACRLVGKKRTT